MAILILPRPLHQQTPDIQGQGEVTPGWSLYGYAIRGLH